MPITQQRMLAVLDEAEYLERFARELRSDLQRILRSGMAERSILEAINATLSAAAPPPCTQCAVERDHFRRARRRNEKNAKRMRAQRQHQHHHHAGRAEGGHR